MMKTRRIPNPQAAGEETPQMQQYVVFATLKNASFSLPALLKTYPKIKVLQELDKSAALVEMSADTSRAIAGENPDIVVEPNLRYSLQSAH